MASSKARGERERGSYPQRYVDDSAEPRTKIGKCASQGEEAVLTDSGRAGEMLGLSPSC
jgi:hypothetical protein